MVMVYPEIPGIQTPRVEWEPAPICGTLGEEAIDLAAVAGLYADPWQEHFIKRALSVRPDLKYFNKYTGRDEAKWQTFENTLIVPRQNGKGSILEIRELAGLFLFGERTLIHTAHNFDTAREGFIRISELIEDTPSLNRYVKRISNSHGSEGIFLKSGQRLLFKTRTASGGRGFTGDFLVLDEAMFLGAAQIGALMPTLAARPNPQIFYTGSAGDQEIGDCSQLGRLRERAIERDDPRLYFAEWSIDPCTDRCRSDCDKHDPSWAVESYAKANPGLGIRITVEHIESERRSMKLKTFLTERLSVGNYPVTGEGWKVISKPAWLARTDYDSQMSEKFALAVDTTPDSGFSCIAACGDQVGNADLQHVEITVGKELNKNGERIVDHRPGTQWVVPRVIDLWERLKPTCVVIDTVGQAGSFIDELEEAGVRVVSPSGREFGQACGEFFAAVVPAEDERATLVHIGQQTLQSAVAQADTRKLTDMWAWSKANSVGDISPLVAATLARWGLKHAPIEEVPDPWGEYV